MRINPPPAGGGAVSLNGGYFEPLDLFDLWSFYGNLKVVAKLRNVSISKVSRRVAEFIDHFGIPSPSSPGLSTETIAYDSECLTYLRLAYQQWRLQAGAIKVYPTFACASLCGSFAGPWDLLRDWFHRPEQIRQHLLMRRIDLIMSSSLDVACELLAEIRVNPDSPIVAFPLFREPIQLLFHPDHPLADVSILKPDDLSLFSSPAYPAGVAPFAAEALQPLGLWRSECRSQHFVLADWYGAMRFPTGLSYKTSLLESLIPDLPELVTRDLPCDVEQDTWMILRRDIAASSAMQQLIDQLRLHARQVLMTSSSPWSWLH